MTEFSRKKIGSFVKKLRVRNGDLILVKHGSEIADIQTIGAMADALGNAGLEKTVIFVVDDFDNIRALDESTMNKNGWFRVEALSKLINRKQESEIENTRDDDSSS